MATRGKRSIGQRAATRAKRINKKREAEAPLLARACLIEKTTPQEQEREIRRHEEDFAVWKEKHEQHDRELESKGQLYRFLLRGIIGDEEIERLDERRKIYPASPEYSADFWWGNYRRATGG
jgi:hypothetical protein